MHKLFNLIEGGIIGAALLIIFDHVVGKMRLMPYRNRFNHIYSRPTYYHPMYRSYRDDEEEEDEE